MRIDIARRLRPFSHTPGSSCPLPGSDLRVTVFPTKLCIESYPGSKTPFYQEIPFDLHGPVHDFTAELDLEKGRLNVWGSYKEGYLRYRVSAGVEPHVKWIKYPPCLQPLQPTEDTPYLAPMTEILSLGSHKALDWDLVRRRGNLEDILPVWFRLGQLFPEAKGKIALLSECEEKIASEDKLGVNEAFLKVFKGFFEGIFSPCLQDLGCQGLGCSEGEEGVSPILLLTQGASLMRQLFVQQEKSQVKILPVLPPQFHAGRLIHVNLHEKGLLDLEWSKKMIRRMVLHANNAGPVRFTFQNGVKRFRLRKSSKDRGIILNAGAEIMLEPHIAYDFDNFEK